MVNEHLVRFDTVGLRPYNLQLATGRARLKRKVSFSQRIKETIKAIPRGKVATYSQVAAMAGNYRAARQVAWILHSSSVKEKLPWHRVINSAGGISLEPGKGFEEQKSLLAKEGVKVNRFGRVELRIYLWQPEGMPSSGFKGIVKRIRGCRDL